MDKQDLSAQQSLELITQMIQQTQGKMQKSSFYFLLWGWVITIANLGMYVTLAFTDYDDYAPFWWMLPIPAWIVTMIYSSRQDKSTGTVTHIDRISMWMWICTGLAIAPIIIFGYKINYQINPLVLTLIAIPTFVSGIIMRFRPLLAGGVSFFLLSMVCFLVDDQTQYLIGGVAMLLGYLIPGYLLKYQKEK
ncbi:MAG: hypothetical protein ACK5DD_15875 [Cyclobacteriaceae bacterium]|jgi:hypothetical protein